MKINRLRNIFTAALYILAGASPAKPAQPTFKVIYTVSGNSEPAGLVQYSPDLFFTLIGQTIETITTKGAVTLIATPPSDWNFSFPVAPASNGLVYGAIASGTLASIASFSTKPGSMKTYQQINPQASYSLGLPDGALFGSGSEIPSGIWCLVTGNEQGEITPFYGFPSNQAPISPIYASDGNYYGAAGTFTGTGPLVDYIWRVTPSGSETTLVNLPNGSFGTGYLGSFFQASDGNFYGTTPVGGTYGYGTLYKVTPAGQYSVVYSFSKGVNGTPGMAFQASDGNFYGVTRGPAGPTSAGEIFEVTPAGVYTGLHEMTGNDGVCPCTLLQASDGLLYGTALAGGKSGDGTVFSLDLGLPKPAPEALSFSPTSGAPGAEVRIWGHNLLSASVQFNGVAATAAHSSGPNYVWATVPAGTSSGPITVTTPGGTSVTTASFTVE